jgi:hypothetical protein
MCPQCALWMHWDALPWPHSGSHHLAAPHPYIPPGPVEVTPYAGFCQPEIRQAATTRPVALPGPGAPDSPPPDSEASISSLTRLTPG